MTATAELYRGPGSISQSLPGPPTVDDVPAEEHALLEAGRAAAARLDWAGAHRDLTRAADHQALRADDLLLLSDAAWWLGRMAETMALSERVHRLYVEEGRLDRAALCALTTGELWLISGEVPVGLGWIARARRLLAELPEGEVHGYLVFADGQLALETGDDAAVSAATRRLADLARRQASPTLEALGLLLAGTQAVRAGRTTEGFALLDEAMLPVLAGQVEDGFAGNLYCQVMGLCAEVGDVRRMRTWLRTTEKWCARFSDAVMFVGICRMHRVQLLVLDAAWDEAAREAGLVQRELAEMNAMAVAEAHYQLGELHRRRGVLDDAAREYDAARALGHAAQPGAALLRLAEGRPEDAWSAIAGALEAGPPPSRWRCLGPAVEIALAGRRLTAATALADELTAVAERTPGSLFRAAAPAARGRIDLADGRPAAAVVALREAVRTYTDLGVPHEAAQVQALLAEACAAAGVPTDAEAAASAAAEARRRLGLLPSPHRTTSGTLTAREREVLRLVADGASNHDVAEQLTLSDKTVGRHLANVYAKLGVTSRTAAVARAREQRLI